MGDTYAAAVHSGMYRAEYYRGESERARRIAKRAHGEVHDVLMRLAQDFDEIAEDLESGAVEIRHAEMMPQNDRN